MSGARTWCRSLAICAFVLGLAAIAAPSYAQTGQVKGKVVDANGKPIEGAVVTIEGSDSGGRKFTVKTNKSGEFIQIGLQPGQYKITADQGRADADLQPAHQPRHGRRSTSRLKPGGGGGDVVGRGPQEGRGQECGASRRRSRKASRSATPARTTRRLPSSTKCWRGARSAWSATPTSAPTTRRRRTGPRPRRPTRRRSRSNPNSAEAYNGLANVYNAQKKFDQAAEASAQAQEAAGAAGRRAAPAAAATRRRSFNQGVILWNAGKIPEAKKQFEEAVEGRPEAGRSALLARHGEPQRRQDARGGVPHFEEYLKLAPTGQYAEQAKGILDVRSRSSPARCPSPTNLAAVRARIAAAARAGRAGPAAHHARRRLQDVRRRRGPRSRAPPASGTSAKTGCRKPCRRSPRPADTPMRWHLIGHLQSNKAKKAAPAFACIHSVDSLELLRKLDDAAAAEPGRGPLEVLVQVDLAGEATKFGAPPDEARAHRPGAAVGRARPAVGLMLHAAVERGSRSRRGRGSCGCARCAIACWRRASPRRRCGTCRWA